MAHANARNAFTPFPSGDEHAFRGADIPWAQRAGKELNEQDLIEIYHYVRASIPAQNQPAPQKLVLVKQRRPAVDTLRIGFVAFMALEMIGMALLVVAVAAHPLLTGIGFAFMFMGLAELVFVVFGYSVVTDQYVITSRFAVTCIVAFLGLTLTSIASTLQVWLR